MRRPRPAVPRPGQESVWDYPRPPRLEWSGRHVVVASGGITIADSRRTLRVLETSHPPTWYIDPRDVDLDLLEAAPGRSWCEWKGQAVYWTVRAGDAVAEGGAWSYPSPSAPYEELVDHVAFYPSRFECSVDGERVRPQPGEFYGGWVTDDVCGPFKGEPGTRGW